MPRKKNKRLSPFKKLIYLILTQMDLFQCRRMLARLTPEQLATVIRRVHDFPDDFLEREDWE